MHKLVDAVNQKIRAAIGRFGDQAVFISRNPDVDYVGGHYCEPSVDEWNTIDREHLAFYEWEQQKLLKVADVTMNTQMPRTR